MTAHRPLSLEELFGHPSDEGTLSYSVVLESDARRCLPRDAEELLVSWGAGAEFVPVHLGGRWLSTRDLVDRIMPIFRRDPALGLGFGITSFMAALNVWLAGSPAQQADIAHVLLSGGRVSVGFHELEHGNDLTHNECTLQPGPSGSLLLNGSKAVINNLDRAERVVLMARSSQAEGPRSHSLVICDPRKLADEALHRGYRTAGMRGVRLGGADLVEVPVAEGSMIGNEGQATELALRSFQVTRSVLPALAVGSLDAALHLAIEYSEGRSLYGTTVQRLPQSRQMIASAYADLLIGDALASCSVRALHTAPEHSYFLSAACKYLVPEILQDGFDELADLFGSTFYGAVAPYGVIEKFVRDLAVLPIGHAGGMSCLMTLLPHLPRWARGQLTAYNRDLFVDAVVDTGIEFSRLGLSVKGSDPLTSVLHGSAVTAARVISSETAELIEQHAEHLAELRAQIIDLPRATFTAVADGATFAMGREVAIHLSAAACVGSWYEARNSDTPAGDISWLKLALERTAWLLGMAAPYLSEQSQEFALTTLNARQRGRRSARVSAEEIFPECNPMTSKEQ